MKLKTLFSLFLSLVIAAPAVPASSFALPPAGDTVAVKSLAEEAFDAGVTASLGVFSHPEETSDAVVVVTQSNNELRTICLSDCERELQQCQSDRRAGEHTQNCSAILDACTDVCWARWPPPPPPKDNTGRMVAGVLLGLAVFGVLMALGEEE